MRKKYPSDISREQFAIVLPTLARYCWRSPGTVFHPLALAKAAKEDVRVWA
jgi:hypothetical protein